MTLLVALTGLSGSGKSTAIQHLSALCGGEIVYLGAMVLREVEKRGLPPTRDSEQSVRLLIREELGPGALAVLATDLIDAHISNSRIVFVDAIFALQEFLHLKALYEEQRAHLLAISASFAVRAERLRKRANRPFTEQQLAARDATELGDLQIGQVFERADHTVVNEGGLEAFQEALTDWWGSIRSV